MMIALRASGGITFDINMPSNINMNTTFDMNMNIDINLTNVI